MRWPVVLLGVAGCYAPDPAPGAPCGERGLCPTPLVCAVDGRCERTAGAVDAAPGTTDGTNDGPVPLVDAAPGASCWAAWRSGAPVLSAPAKVTELSTADAEGDPALSADALTLYFARGPAGNADLFQASRPDRSSPFGTATAMADLNSPQDDTKASLSGDGHTAIVASKRQVILAGSTLFQATRATTGAAFGTPMVLGNGFGLSAAFDPELSADGLVLYYSTVPLAGTQAIMRTSRAGPGGTFGTGATVAISGATGAVADPTVSPDERVLVFTSNVPTNDLFLATRASPQLGFALVGPLSVNSSSALDGDASLTRDGCELFFMSDRAGNRDLYRAIVTPQ